MVISEWLAFILSFILFSSYFFPIRCPRQDERGFRTDSFYHIFFFSTSNHGLVFYYCVFRDVSIQVLFSLALYKFIGAIIVVCCCNTQVALLGKYKNMAPKEKLRGIIWLYLALKYTAVCSVHDIYLRRSLNYFSPESPNLKNYN